MRKTIILVFLFLQAITATAQNVTNAHFVQDAKQVKIYYDLSEEADISIYLSTDGGKTYETSPLGHLTGHAGANVAAGAGRCAVWDVLAGREKLQSAHVRFKIVAARRDANQTFIVDGVRFTMVYVQGGTFNMGRTREQGAGYWVNNDDPVHSVTLSDYHIGETEVTQALWKAVMGNTPSHWRHLKREILPVESISWYDAQEFCHKLSQKTGRTFRLPTEAEWEYAARGGKKSRGYKYSGSNTLSDVAWYSGNSSGQTHPVKGKQANELGLYDMSGNVMEWCQDWFGDYGSYSQINPTGPSSGSECVVRGGSWGHSEQCRVAYRINISPSNSSGGLGLRVVLVR